MERARVVPRCMSTQHPDNVAVPFFAPHPIMSGEDEIKEAFYAYSHLGCDEQMWDAEGKEADELVVEKLLGTYGSFFRERPLGEAVFLTPRVPNPSIEPGEAKILLEVLHSLPRHSDVARLFHERERPPIVEVILPMVTSARELERIVRYYAAHVAGVARVVLPHDDRSLGDWFGSFEPQRIDVIPLIEDRDRLVRGDAIVREYLARMELPQQRVFVARSDPALNYGMTSAVLLALVALDRLHALERDAGIPIYPIVGLGGAPFRGNLRPERVERVLSTYPSVQTFTIQSAFKYDHPIAEVTRAIQTLRSTPRRAPLPIAGDERALRIVDRATAAYQRTVTALAPLVRATATHVPRRRMRKLHVGLFGYSRAVGEASLPRAIPLCASLYSLGLPPEIIGMSALDDADRRWLAERVPGIEQDLADAVRYLDPDVAADLPAVRDDVAFGLTLGQAPDGEHVALSRQIRRGILEGPPHGVDDLVVRAASLRRFLG